MTPTEPYYCTPQELEYHKRILRHLKGLLGAYESLVKLYDIPPSGYAVASSDTEKVRQENVR